MRRLVYIVISSLIASVFLEACQEEKHYYVKNIGNGAETPTMRTTDVDTYISDSGYTRYYIKTPIWDMYDEAQNPFWFFPEGVELEQYDTEQNIESTLRCDSAKYLTQDRIWQLDGRVVMVNVDRDTFFTNQVFWDQVQRKIYSDSFMHIVKSDRIIEGYGFESNEAMSAYVVQNPTGIFPVEKQQGSESKSQKAESESPTNESEYEYDENTRRARAPIRASQRATQPEMFHIQRTPTSF